MISQNFNFQFELHAKLLRNLIPCELNQGKDISGMCLTSVDNEVGMLWRKLRISKADTFQSNCLDESAGKISRRILKH